MTDRFEFSKLFLGTLAAVVVILFTVIGIQTTWSTYVVKDYNKHLTGQVYVDAAVNQNVNLVFYRNGCPYCKAGKKAVIAVAEKSSYPKFTSMSNQKMASYWLKNTTLTKQRLSSQYGMVNLSFIIMQLKIKMAR